MCVAKDDAVGGMVRDLVLALLSAVGAAHDVHRHMDEAHTVNDQPLTVGVKSPAVPGAQVFKLRP